MLGDEERTDSLMRLSYGLLWDLAEVFRNGEIKGLLLQPWVVQELRPKGRILPETRKFLRHAREAIKNATQ